MRANQFKTSLCCFLLHFHEPWHVYARNHSLPLLSECIQNSVSNTTTIKSKFHYLMSRRWTKVSLLICFPTVSMVLKRVHYRPSNTQTWRLKGLFLDAVLKMLLGHVVRSTLHFSLKNLQFQSGPRVVKMVLNTPCYKYLWLTMWFHTKRSKEMLKKLKSLILLCKFGSRAQKWR